MRQCNRPARRVTGDVYSKDKDDFCQETCEMPIVSWKYSHELEAGVAGVQGMCRRQAAVSQCSRPARRVTADVCSKKKTAFARKLMKCPLFPGNIRLSLKEEEAGCTAMCRRQAADSQCNRPAGRVTGDVCSKDKDDFCQETYELPIVSWKYSHELEAGEGGVQGHVQAAGRREPMQSSGRESDRGRVQ